ncbi:MAG: hypothetical protein GX443_12490 [Deltaproteobacteria bacterium]|nr:hypothetical protein [Deltaproteobacteria bacterium]
MTPFKVSNDHSVPDIGHSGMAVDRFNLRLGTEKGDPASGVENHGWIKVSTSQLNGLRSVDSSLNKVARTIRHADSAMEKIGELLGEMKSKLESIVKNYPPFPPGTEERARYLESYNGLRSQMAQLAIPPEKEGAGAKMFPPTEYREGGNWEFLVEKDGQLRTVHKGEIQLNLEGLDIPELKPDASDEEVYLALQRLDAGREILDSRRQALAEDAEAIINSLKRSLESHKLYPSYGEQMKLSEDEEAAVGRMSALLQETLSSAKFVSLTNASAALAELLY